MYIRMKLHDSNVITFDPLHWPNVITFAGFRITWPRQWLYLRWCSNEWFQPIRISDTYLYRAKCNGNVISVSGSKYFTSLHFPHYISNVITFATTLVGSPPGQKYTHFCSEWCIVGYGTNAPWDLWIWCRPLYHYVNSCILHHNLRPLLTKNYWEFN